MQILGIIIVFSLTLFFAVKKYRELQMMLDIKKIQEKLIQEEFWKQQSFNE